MSEAEEAVAPLIFAMYGVSTSDSLQHSAVRDEPEPIRYVLLGGKNGATYEVTWDKDERVVILRKVTKKGLGPECAIRITHDTKLGEEVWLRDASKKEGNSHYSNRGPLLASIKCTTPIPLADLTKVFDYAMHVQQQIAAEERQEEAAEHDQPPEEPAAKAPAAPTRPAEPKGGPVEIAPGVWGYTQLTEPILTKGGYFYLTKAGVVSNYTFDPLTGLATLEKMFASDSVPKNIKYLTKHPSTIDTSPAQGRGQNWRGPVGPFDHIIRSEKKMTAKEVRALFKLAGPHQTQSR
jgi:hypothetical protein